MTLPEGSTFPVRFSDPFDRWLAGDAVGAWEVTPTSARPEFLESVAAALIGPRHVARNAATRRHVRRVLVVLLERGFARAERTRQRRSGEAVVHVVQFALAHQLWPGVPLETARRRLRVALQTLARLGLVRYRARAVRMPSGALLRSGTVVRLRLRPGPVGPFLPGDLAYRWRDLEADIAAGRVAAQLSRTANVDRKRRYEEEKTIGFALESLQSSLGVWESSSPAGRRALADLVRDLELVRDRTHLEVGRVAAAIAAALSDTGSLRYYAGLLWRALRAGRLHALAQQLERLLAEVAEGGVRRPGALFASRMGRLGAG